MTPQPIRLFYDEEQRSIIPSVEPIDGLEIPLAGDMPDDWTGIMVYLYDTVHEAHAFVDAVDLLYDAETSTKVYSVAIGHDTCGVVILFLDWLGPKSIFRDRRTSCT